MKQILIILICSFLIQSLDCFSQSNETKLRHIYGYSNDFNDVTLSLVFGRISGTEDINYYVRIQIDLSKTEDAKMFFPKGSTLSFLTKSGKTIELNMDDVSSNMKLENRLSNSQISDIKQPLIKVKTIPVTKEQLVEIGAEPFYKIIIPYYVNSSKSDKLIFSRPALLTGRDFTTEDVRRIL